MNKVDSFEPWKKFIPRPTYQNIFYYVSPHLCPSVSSKASSYYLYPNKELSEIIGYTNPIVAILCRAVFDTCQDEDSVWLLSGNPDGGQCSIEGRVGLSKCTILKKTNFKLWMVDAFKVAGGAIMKVHDDKIFTEWFLDSIGDRTNQNMSTLEISRYSRNIAEKYKETNIDKSYEFLAVANLAEYKESKEPNFARRRKLGQAFLYAVHAAALRGKDINLSEICEKTLTLIRTESIGLPVKVDDESGWSPYSLHA